MLVGFDIGHRVFLHLSKKTNFIECKFKESEVLDFLDFSHF